jgi:beta-glucosidase
MVAHGYGDLQHVSALALKAGLDMDMVGEGFVTTLQKSLAEGKISTRDIDTACRRILEAKWKLGLFDDPFRSLDPARKAISILTPAHRAAAREIAAHSCVLLKNNNQVLPLKPGKTVALVGPLADDKVNMAGTWSVAVDPQDSVGVLEGLRNAVPPETKILYAKGANITDDPAMAAKLNVFGEIASIDKRDAAALRAEAVAIAQQSDIIVAVVGEAKEHAGECSSRTELSIPESQRQLIAALKATGKPLVLVTMSGRPLTLEWENSVADAILHAWHGGTEAGNAIADVLLGVVNPGGKLAMTFPRNVGQIPIYYAHRTTGRPWPGKFEKFKTSYLDVENTPLYAFGHGLSYTNFTVGAPRPDKQALKGDERLTVDVMVKNDGDRAGHEVVQLYITDPVASTTRPVQELKHFRKIHLKPGEKTHVTFTLSPEDLKFWNDKDKRDWESGEFIIHVGNSSDNTQSVSVQWDKGPAPNPRQSRRRQPQ